MPRSSARRRAARPLAAACALLAALACAPAVIAAVDGIAWVGQMIERSQDDPRAALRQAGADPAMQGQAPEQQLWRGIARARLLGLLEQPDEARRAIDDARRALRSWPDAGPLPRLALRLHALQTDALTEDPEKLRESAEALEAEIRQAGHPRLACEMAGFQVWLLLETGAIDRAWQRAEQAERCAGDLGDVGGQAGIAVQRGMMASAATDRLGGERAPHMHFERALGILGDRPARYLRSVIEWEMGNALGGQDPPRELAHYEHAQALSASIGDEVGEAIAQVSVARVAQGLGDNARALALALRARATLQRHQLPQRMPATYAVSIPAMTQLRDPRLPAEIDAARAWDTPAASPRVRAQLAKLVAEGYASLGQYHRAYEAQRHYAQLDLEGRKDESNRTVLRLQASFEAAQRDAENARLRLREESSRLQLEAADARQQRLWAALAAAATALLATAVVAARTLRQRRQLADLASRDELTGAPNRRAVLAIARSQWAHSRRLRTPMAVAVIDLDHFKRVNDTWGHDVGDRVLKAFAQAASATLRAQDQFGRYGGEEWLLVAPGAGPLELQAIFRRLRERFAAAPIEGLAAPHGLTFSMGGAADHPGAASIAALITEADQRLYRAKAQGRDRAVVDDAGAPTGD